MKKRWYRLDNAALIFPAVMKKKWNNAFRVSVTMKETVDPGCLQQAAEVLRFRFPSFFVRLRTGLFWYYLEEIKKPFAVKEDYAYPLTHMTRRELSECCIRILWFENRIAVEIFHSVTDGTGGMHFLKNLAAEYLRIRYGAAISRAFGVSSPEDTPAEWEAKDRFPEFSNGRAMTRREENAYRLSGEKTEGFTTLTTGVVPTERLLESAHGYGVSVTVFLSAVMAEALASMQAHDVPCRKYRPVKITVPVNLRKCFGTDTLKNFVLTLNLGFDPRMGAYSLGDICRQLKNQLEYENIPQRMASRIAANVIPAQNPVVRLMPLFIKNLVMRLVYRASGERKGCINISNLGRITVPEEMNGYIERFEFIIGVQYSYPNNCSVASFGENTFINMIRNISGSELERRFFSRLVELGIPVAVECNVLAGCI